MALVADCFAGPSTSLSDLDELAFDDDTPGSSFDDGLCSTIVYTWSSGAAPPIVYLFIEGGCARAVVAGMRCGGCRATWM
jgi:hypothetical protein